jgi:hypothetical protein
VGVRHNSGVVRAISGPKFVAAEFGGLLTPSVGRVWIPVALAALSLGMSACQEATHVSVVNGCEVPIEVDARDEKDPAALGYKLHWRSVKPGDTVRAGDHPKPLRRLFLFIRLEGSDDVPPPHEVDASALQHSGDDKVTLVIAGALCPG